MRFVGVDVAASKGLALAVVGDDDGQDPVLLTSPIFNVRGAQRLTLIRGWVFDQTPMDTAAAVVELPFSPRSSFVLPSIAAVSLEAIQAKCPGAVTLEMPTSSWRLGWFGRGNASKDDSLALAALAGVEATEDEAEALAMALLARKRWQAAVAAA